MTLREYFRTINKNNCPQNCEFKSKDIEPALVPPPDEILGIVVSQDPTILWSHFYKYSKNEYREDNRRKMLFASAIPYSLFNKIIEFMDGQITDEDESSLFDMMFQKVYWTHLHKCFTDGSEKKSLKFKPTNAKQCADWWLKKELGHVISNKTRFIIALGKPVHDWIEKNWNQRKNKGIKIINLPHPSGRNNRIWYCSKKDKYRIKKKIKTLVELCKEISK